MFFALSVSDSNLSIEMGKLPPIGVFWDIENCHVPKGKSALHFVSKIRNEFFVGHAEAEFMCVCDTKKECPDTIQELQDAQVSFHNYNSCMFSTKITKYFEDIVCHLIYMTACPRCRGHILYARTPSTC